MVYPSLGFVCSIPPLYSARVAKLARLHDSNSNDVTLGATRQSALTKVSNALCSDVLM